MGVCLVCFDAHPHARKHRSYALKLLGLALPVSLLERGTRSQHTILALLLLLHPLQNIVRQACLLTSDGIK